MPVAGSVIAMTEKSPYLSPLASIDTWPAMPDKWNAPNNEIN